MANELRFLDGNLLFVDGNLAMSEDCCCDEEGEPIACGDCGMSSTSEFQVAIPGIGTFTLTNLTYSASSNCVWDYSGSPSSCGDLVAVGVQWNSANGGWNVSVELRNGVFNTGTWRSTLTEVFAGCGPWSIDCDQFFGTFGACAKTSVTTYTVTVTLL